MGKCTMAILPLMFATFHTAAFAALGPEPAYAQEISLLDSEGSAVAYIDVDDDATIYLWAGSPVAYLDEYDGETWDVYGFNGQHLGWFDGGAIWAKSGYAACATKEAFAGLAKLEKLKGLQRLKPLKALRKLAPLQPVFRDSFDQTNCALHLLAGSK